MKDSHLIPISESKEFNVFLQPKLSSTEHKQRRDSILSNYKSNDQSFLHFLNQYPQQNHGQEPGLEKRNISLPFNSHLDAQNPKNSLYQYDLNMYKYAPNDSINSSMIPKNVKKMLLENDIPLELGLLRNKDMLFSDQGNYPHIVNTPRYPTSSSSKASWDFLNDEDSGFSENESMYSYFSDYSRNILKGAQNTYREKSKADKNTSIPSESKPFNMNVDIKGNKNSSKLVHHTLSEIEFRSRTASVTREQPQTSMNQFDNWNSFNSDNQFAQFDSQNFSYNFAASHSSKSNNVYPNPSTNDIDADLSGSNMFNSGNYLYYRDADDESDGEYDGRISSLPEPIERTRFKPQENLLNSYISGSKQNKLRNKPSTKGHSAQNTRNNVNSLQDQAFKTIQDESKFEKSASLDNFYSEDEDFAFMKYSKLNQHERIYAKELNQAYSYYDNQYPPNMYTKPSTFNPDFQFTDRSESLSPTFTSFDHTGPVYDPNHDPLFDPYTTTFYASTVPTKGILYFTLFIANTGVSVASPAFSAYTIDKLVNHAIGIFSKNLRSKPLAQNLLKALQLFGASVIFKLLGNYINRLFYLCTLQKVAEKNFTPVQPKSSSASDLSLFLSKNTQKIAETAIFGWLLSHKLSKKYVAGLSLYHVLSNFLINYSFSCSLLLPVSDNLNQLQGELFDADKEQIFYEEGPSSWHNYNSKNFDPTHQHSNYSTKLPFFNLSNYLPTQTTSVGAKFSYLLSKLNIELSHGLDLKKIESNIFFGIESLDYLQNSTSFIFCKLLPLYYTLNLVAKGSSPYFKHPSSSNGLSDTLIGIFYLASFSDSLSHVLSDLTGILFHSKKEG